MNHKKTANFKDFHLEEPDYTQEGFRFTDQQRSSIYKKLLQLYNEDVADRYLPEIERRCQVYYAHKTSEMLEWELGFHAAERFSEKDVILITYGDMIIDESQSPLQTLYELCGKYLKDIFNTIHILPFFPYTSDRGFAITNFEEVNPRLGTWDDILAMKKDFRLMFDGVFNHVSSKNRWFQEFLNQNPYFENFFTSFNGWEEVPKEELKKLFRPRTSDVLTPFQTLNGMRLVWTTFSKDQVDLKFQNPDVLVKILQVLLIYVRRGADIIRLDAVTYLWDELGTTGIHLAQNHIIIKLFREILDAVAPYVALITETNVPHEENISYFGNYYDEAQMVYNFALPPLVLYSFHKGNAEKLTSWASKLHHLSDTATFFNFLDSHDGIGLMAVKNILTKEEIDTICMKILEHGGKISYKTEFDGSHSPYELNVTFFSALNADRRDETLELHIKRYLAARSIQLVFMGVPGVYLHGLLGSKNDIDAIKEKKEYRDINRKTLNKKELVKALENTHSTSYKISYRLGRMIMKRIGEKSFHPNAMQRIIDNGSMFFSVLRTSADKTEAILAVTNITNQVHLFELDLSILGIPFVSCYEILSKQHISFTGEKISFEVEPYGVWWLKTIIENRE